MAGTHPPLPAALALLTVASVMLAGCSSTSPAHEFTCGPPEEPRTCGFFEARRAEAAFTEVEERYRATAHLADLMRMDPEGNHDLSLLHEYTTDPFLKDSQLIQEKYKDDDLYVEAELPITRIDWISFSDVSLTIAICADGTDLAARRIDTDEVIKYGDVVRGQVVAEHQENEWKLTSGEQVDPQPCKD